MLNLNSQLPSEVVHTQYIAIDLHVYTCTLYVHDIVYTNVHVLIRIYIIASLLFLQRHLTMSCLHTVLGCPSQKEFTFIYPDIQRDGELFLLPVSCFLMEPMYYIHVHDCNCMHMCIYISGELSTSVSLGLLSPNITPYLPCRP